MSPFGLIPFGNVSKEPGTHCPIHPSLSVLNELSHLNVEFLSFRENYTGGPHGRAIIVIIGAIAELERNFLSKECALGCAATGAPGAAGGTGPTGPAGPSGGINGIAEFTSSGTFTVPPGVNKLLVEMYGAGGGMAFPLGGRMARVNSPSRDVDVNNSGPSYS